MGNVLQTEEEKHTKTVQTKQKKKTKKKTKKKKQQQQKNNNIFYAFYAYIFEIPCHEVCKYIRSLYLYLQRTLYFMHRVAMIPLSDMYYGILLCF